MTTSTKRKNSDPEEKTGQGIEAFFVPLYLVILAFFILLNSISIIEKEKERKALGSIREKFAYQATKGETSLEISRAGVFEPVKNSISPIEFLSPIARIAEANFEIVKAQNLDNNQRLQVIASISDFFPANNTSINKDQKNFLTNLTKEFLSLNSTSPVYLEIIFGSRLILSDNSEIAEIQQASSFARALIDLSMPEDKISVGVSDENPGKIIMNFYIE